MTFTDVKVCEASFFFSRPGARLRMTMLPNLFVHSFENVGELFLVCTAELFWQVTLLAGESSNVKLFLNS